MEFPDTLVLNDDIKRRSKLECYNCGEEYEDGVNGQGVHVPGHLNTANREYCDVVCLLAFAKLMIQDDFRFADYHEAICQHLGYRPFLAPSRNNLQRFGGDMTIEQYKWGQQPGAQTTKRVKVETEIENTYIELPQFADEEDYMSE